MSKYYSLWAASQLFKWMIQHDLIWKSWNSAEYKGTHSLNDQILELSCIGDKVPKLYCTFAPFLCVGESMGGGHC